MTFAEWVVSPHTLQDMKECRDVARKRIEPGANLVTMYLEEMLDISGIALKLLEEAQDYHAIKIEALTTEERKTNPTGNPKTILDFAKRWPCKELTVLESMKNLARTIELRVTCCQSIIKGLR